MFSKWIWCTSSDSAATFQLVAKHKITILNSIALRSYCNICTKLLTNKSPFSCVCVCFFKSAPVNTAIELLRNTFELTTCKLKQH